MPRANANGHPFIRHPLTRSYRPVGQSLHDLPTVRGPQPRPKRTRQRSPTGQLADFRVPYTKHPSCVQLPHQNPTRRVHPMVTSCHTATIVNRHTRVSTVTRGYFFFHYMDSILRRVSSFLNARRSQTKMERPVEQTGLP